MPGNIPAEKKDYKILNACLCGASYLDLDFKACGAGEGECCRVTRGLAFLEDDRLRAVETYQPSAVGPALVALRELTAQATRDVRVTALLDVSMMARAAREEVRRRGAAIGGGV